MGLSACSFIGSVNQQMFTEHLLCAGAVLGAGDMGKNKIHNPASTPTDLTELTFYLSEGREKK